MGKRSDFERIERDYYKTFDPKAGLTISSHLPENGEYTYAEPFCGSGDLIKQLTGQCNYASDIEPDYENKVVDNIFIKKSFRDVNENDLKKCDMVITNPPWDRKILHETIEHFSNMKPTWLLFDSNWMFTKQSEKYINRYCLKIITVGRMIWIPGTKISGKDDVCWYLFDANKKENDLVSFEPRKSL